MSDPFTVHPTGPRLRDADLCAACGNQFPEGQCCDRCRPSGHDLAREVIAKHGADRYPTVELALLKLTEELGELVQAWLKVLWGSPGPDVLAAFRKEYGDVGLTLHALGNLLELDLETEMKAVVDAETRRFG